MKRMVECDHELKVWPSYFRAIAEGRKTFEARRDDRGYQTGENLRLREYDPDNLLGYYTGAELTAKITYILTGGQFGIESGFVVMGLKIIQEREPAQNQEDQGMTVRVCPKRDAECPHGLKCPFALDKYRCKPEESTHDALLEEARAELGYEPSWQYLLGKRLGAFGPNWESD